MKPARSAENDGSFQWVKPKRWQELGALAFRLKEIPHQEFLLIFPEWFTSREMSTGARFHRQERPNARTWEGSPYSASLTFHFEKSGRHLHLKWEYTFANGADGDLTDLSAFNCLNLNRAPVFKDLSMERTRVGGRKGNGVVLKDVPRTQGAGRRTMQFYPAVQGADLNRIEKIKNYGVTSTAHLPGDRIAAVSRDAHWLVESIVDGPVAYFFNNWEPDHGCIHAAPLFGTVKAGETSTASGRISFTPLT